MFRLMFIASIGGFSETRLRYLAERLAYYLFSSPFPYRFYTGLS
jgi:hypothetical protein